MKLDNILVARSGTLAVSDFGLCALHDESSDLRERTGTKSMWPPEVPREVDAPWQCNCEPCRSLLAPVELGYGTGVDIWASGVMMLQLLAGPSLENPFVYQGKVCFGAGLAHARRVASRAPAGLLPRLLMPCKAQRITATEATSLLA